MIKNIKSNFCCNLYEFFHGLENVRKVTTCFLGGPQSQLSRAGFQSTLLHCWVPIMGWVAMIGGIGEWIKTGRVC